ncbi:hypothetical protein BOTNAR_0287g00130 [Botryotinia narcissicola]|uniref:Uncharacterized protein n=1 Tax=Botryotinia narcissicola TaxID=278944 RepID=A0A4Z1IA82_9HELO|nr:hypothetical protein BOTNAR_0287g00130 [Botryotinia narcissicola]
MAAVQQPIQPGQIGMDVGNHRVNSPSNLTTAFAVGTFTILAYVAMPTQRFQYIAVVDLHHPEEVAFAKAQHQRTSSRLRGSMRGVVFANSGWWRGEGRNEGENVRLMGRKTHEKNYT